MIGIYLITGFLGAGKTTFLKNFIRLHSSKRMRIVINEFGKEGIDGKLLKELPVIIDEINNGSIFCSCRLEQFEKVLVVAIDDNPELIIIEASGLSDPTNVKKILSDKRFSDKAEFLGSICIVDAINFKKVISTARICKKQLSISDLVIVNKTDIASDEDIKLTQKLIFELYPDIVTHLTSFGEIDASCLLGLSTKKIQDVSVFQTRELGLQKALLHLCDNIELFSLQKLLEMIVEDSYRIKGFVKIKSDIYLVSCVSSIISIEKFDGTLDETDPINSLVVLAGASMPMEKSLLKAFNWYKNVIVSIES